MEWKPPDYHSSDRIESSAVKVKHEVAQIGANQHGTTQVCPHRGGGECHPPVLRKIAILTFSWQVLYFFQKMAGMEKK